MQEAYRLYFLLAQWISQKFTVIHWCFLRLVYDPQRKIFCMTTKLIQDPLTKEFK